MAKSAKDTLKAAIVPAIISAIASLLVAWIGLHWSGKQALDSAISKRQSEIDEMVQKQLTLKTGFIPGEIRSFAFGGSRNEEAIKELREMGWLECAGQELQIANYGVLYKRIKETWGSATPGSSFSVPDLRGMFLRGWTDGSTSDPDAAKRTSNKPRGAVGNNVGSVQPDSLQSHTHRDPKHSHTLQGFNYKKNTGDGGDFGHMFNMEPPVTTSLSATGIAEPVALPGELDVRHGSETRPKNVYVSYWIYVGSSIPTPIPDGSKP